MFAHVLLLAGCTVIAEKYTDHSCDVDPFQRHADRSTQENVAQQQDAIFHGPRRRILDLSTHILMTKPDQT